MRSAGVSLEAFQTRLVVTTEPSASGIIRRCRGVRAAAFRDEKPTPTPAATNVYPAYGGVGFPLFGEQFSTRVRMPGVAVGTQFGFALGGFAPSIAAILAGPTLATWVPVAIFGCAASLVATIAGLTMRETYRTNMHDLGKPERRQATSVAITAAA